MTFEFCTLGHAKLSEQTKLLTVHAQNELTDDPTDVEELGDLAWYGQLGMVAMPYPKTDGGFCQGFVARGAGGSIGVILGARDSRVAGIVGNMKPGDTVIHSTGPNQAAQLQLKEEKRQAVLVSKDSSGATMLLALDGKNDKVQIATAFGFVEVSEENGICLTSKTGAAGIQIKDDVVSIFGKVVLGGRTPAGNVQFGTVPVVGGVGGASAPAPGVYIGV